MNQDIPLSSPQRAALLYHVATTEDPIERNGLANKIVFTVQAREGVGDATFTNAVLEQAEHPSRDSNSLLVGVLFPGVDPNDQDTIYTARALAESVLR